MNKTPLEIQKELYQKRINSLRDSIRQRDEQINILQGKVNELERLLEKDHYKDRNKKLESQKLILIHSLNEINRKPVPQGLREFISDTIQKVSA